MRRRDRLALWVAHYIVRWPTSRLRSARDLALLALAMGLLALVLVALTSCGGHGPSCVPPKAGALPAASSPGPSGNGTSNTCEVRK